MGLFSRHHDSRPDRKPSTIEIQTVRLHGSDHPMMPETGKIQSNEHLFNWIHIEVNGAATKYLFVRRRPASIDFDLLTSYRV